MVTLKVSPLTRLEGHLSITAQISDGVVAEAWSHGEMFRGIEKILLGRDPRDAPIITSRICGVCHAIHRNVSLRAIENTSGFEFPGLPGKYKIPDGAG
jgi:Ni,Fe-hydrogenase I large subunit